MVEVGNSLSEDVRECVRENTGFGENDTQQEEFQSLLSNVERLSAKLTGLEGIEFDESPYRFTKRKWRSYDWYDLKEKEASKNNEDVHNYFHAHLDNLGYIENAEVVRQTSLYFGLNLVINMLILLGVTFDVTGSPSSSPTKEGL